LIFQLTYSSFIVDIEVFMYMMAM